MSGSRFERLEALFHEALPLSTEERAALLRRACRDDPTLGTEVERLLAAHDRAGGFIQVPAATLAGMGTADESLEGRRIGPYRVVRELGRGGMGAVYLAERADGAFTQRVAVKLIKRGMDTDHVLARFRAERQILASLNHPNLARLLDGGSTADGLPYLVMEYIEGQPIDAYADARHLSVADRLRLFLDVCDAVSHAHGQGVIHRDIKPLNILVTPAGDPKLLDFGIAKVLDDAADEVTSTVTGLRLLTPEYASPEQVEGRHATAASDVYSLGVVLYELLTGRSPYRLPSRAPQDVAAAVCTTEPERPSAAVTRAPEPGTETVRRRRRDSAAHAAATGAVTARQLSRLLRGDLDTIVLAALRKEPGRRYRSVAAFADDLRRHLDGRPVLARSEGVLYRAGKFARRNRGGVAAAGLAAVAAAIMAAVGLPATRAEDEAPSLLASRALAARDRLLVADFTDRTGGDTTLTAAVTEALRTDLAQSPVVRVMTARQVRASLELMRRPSDVVMDDTLAREVALREGVKAFVTGSLARLSSSYVVTVQLVSAQNGDVLAAIRETAPDSSRLIAAVDRASKALRRRIGESLRELEKMPTLEQASTASLPALRRYTEGQRATRAGHRTLALQRFKEAIALDTGFASAYISLSMAYGSIARPGDAFEARNHAVANQHRLSFLERSFLLASRAYGNEDYPTAIEMYRDVIDRYPDNVPALNNLALAYRDSRRHALAVEFFRRAIQSDSTIANMYFGIHSAELLQGKFAEARATLDLTARRFPGNPILLTEEIQDAAAQQDWDRAERHAKAQIDEAGTDTLRAVDPVEALAGVAMTRGRLDEAERRWRRHFVFSRAAGAMGRHLFGVLQLGYLQLRYRNDPARAVAFMDSALAAMPLEQLLPGDRRFDELARFYTAAGERGRARQMLAAAIADDSVIGRNLVAERSWTRGVIALAEGRGADAVRDLQVAAKLHVCEICPLPDLGRALEAEGRVQEAAEAYDRYLRTPWLWRYEPDAVELGWTIQRLAELQEKLGTGDPAATYTRLLDLWKDADSALRPIVDDVQERLAAIRERSPAPGRTGP
ncbi:MAG TPA: protein kinase [Gemmatimonadales bacterium]|nr:protein kinase [Gemmatimonadales bacterium]